MQVDPAHILKRGLSVRIAIVSGVAEEVRVRAVLMHSALEVTALPPSPAMCKYQLLAYDLAWGKASCISSFNAACACHAVYIWMPSAACRLKHILFAKI